MTVPAFSANGRGGAWTSESSEVDEVSAIEETSTPTVPALKMRISRALALHLGRTDPKSTLVGSVKTSTYPAALPSSVTCRSGNTGSSVRMTKFALDSTAIAGAYSNSSAAEEPGDSVMGNGAPTRLMYGSTGARNDPEASVHASVP